MKRRKLLIIIVIPAVVLISTGAALGLNGFFGGGSAIAQDTFTRGLVGYWGMDEGYGTTTYDGSGNGNDGMMVGGMATTSWTTGKIGGALNFDGTDDYVDAGSGTSLDITDAITLEAWIKPTQKSGTVYVASKWGGATNNSYIMDIEVNTTRLYFFISTDGSNALASNYYTLTQWNVWYHVVGIYDGSYLRLYVNGKEAVTPKSQTGNIYVSPTDLVIGRYLTNYYQGLIDEVRIYNRALSDAEIRYHYNRGGPVAYWKLDEGSGSTAYDSTDNNNDGTLVLAGSATSSAWVSGKYGSALSFDGVDDYVTTSFGNSVRNLTQTSVEMWFQIASLGTIKTLYNEPNPSSNNRLNLNVLNTNVLQFRGRAPDSDGLTIWVTSTKTLSTGVWYHVAAVFDSVADKHYIYLNGVPESASVTAATFTDAAPSVAPRIGLDSDGNNPFNGLIDDVRVYNYARTSEEIRLDYNAGFGAKFGYSLGSCSRDPASCMGNGLVGYWSMDERNGTSTADGSGNGNNGMMTYMATSTNGGWTTGIKPLSGGAKGGGALSFDGVDDYVNAGSRDIINNISSSLTIEAWVKIPDIVGLHGVFQRNGYNLYLAIDGATVRFWVEGSSYSTKIAVTDSILSANTWYHIVATYDDPNAVIYVDGVSKASAVSAGQSAAAVDNAYIGSYGGSTHWFAGLIDEVRIYNRALSAEEVRYHYNRGGPVAHWKFDEGSGRTAYDSSNNSNDGTLVLAGSATSSAWVSGQYGSALSFDGVDDYVTIPNSSSLNVSSAYSYEAWWKKTVNSGYTLLGKWSQTGDQRSWAAYIGTANFQIYYSTDGSDAFFVTAANNTSANTWYHIAVTFDGTNMRIYHNGILIKTDAASPPYQSTSPTFIGKDETGGIAPKWNGLIDDVRIYNYARTPEQIRLDYNAGLAAKLGPSGKDCNSDPASCVSEGLVGYWGFDERQGATVSDSSDNANTGTMYGGMATTSWTTGVRPLTGGVKGGGALNFDGTDDYVNSSAPAIPTTDFTIEGWVNRATIKAQDMVSQWKTETTGRLQFGIDSDDKTRLAIGGVTVSKATTVVGAGWHQIGVTRSSGAIVIYLDGKVDKSGDTNSAAIEQTVNTLIGTYGAGTYFNGIIDEVRIYNRALTVDEVRYHYNKGGPVAQWKMDEGEGRVVYDATNNNNDGTLVLAGSATSSAWVAGKYGSALAFDGVDDYVNAGSGASLRTSAGTVEAWVKSTTDSVGVIFTVRDGTENYAGFSILIGNGATSLLTNELITIARDDGVGDYDNRLGYTTANRNELFDGNWHHIVVTSDSSTYKIYLDGISKTVSLGAGSNNGAWSSGITGTIDTQRIGSNRIAGADSQFLNGLIDEVRIYNYARTPEQIRQDYNAGMNTYFK